MMIMMTLMMATSRAGDQRVAKCFRKRHLVAVQTTTYEKRVPNVRRVHGTQLPGSTLGGNGVAVARVPPVDLGRGRGRNENRKKNRHTHTHTRTRQRDEAVASSGLDEDGVLRIEAGLFERGGRLHGEQLAFGEVGHQFEAGGRKAFAVGVPDHRLSQRRKGPQASVSESQSQSGERSAAVGLDFPSSSLPFDS